MSCTDRSMRILPHDSERRGNWLRLESRGRGNAKILRFGLPSTSSVRGVGAIGCWSGLPEIQIQAKPWKNRNEPTTEDLDSIKTPQKIQDGINEFFNSSLFHRLYEYVISTWYHGLLHPQPRHQPWWALGSMFLRDSTEVPAVSFRGCKQSLRYSPYK